MRALVFISYASADTTAAERVRDDLENDGLACWMAPRDVPASGDYATAISDAIAACGTMLLLLSAASNASEHIHREAHLAVSQKRQIVPVRLEGVKPAGPLEYLLANAQWIDAFPRLEPSLGRLRAEIRLALQRAGASVGVTSVRSPFRRVLAGASAWAVVLGLMTLVLMLIQRQWFNLVPMLSIPLIAVRQASIVLAALALVPVAAVVTQYWCHRSLSRMASLDVLFGAQAGTGVRARSALAAALAAACLAGIWVAPSAISIELEAGPTDQYNADLTRVMSVPSKYVGQHGHYVIRTHIGALNPEGRYTVRLELSPYATVDGVEFGDLLLDKRFGITQAESVPDDPRRAGYVELSGPRDGFAGEREIRLTAAHYRDAAPQAPMVTAYVALAGGSRVNATPQTIPATALAAE